MHEGGCPIQDTGVLPSNLWSEQKGLRDPEAREIATQTSPILLPTYVALSHRTLSKQKQGPTSHFQLLLFRRDGGATATADPGDPAQRVHCKPRGRRRPDQLTPELWTELTGLAAGSSESEDGPEAGAEDRPAEVSLEEALMRLAEFLSVQLGAEESCGNPPELGKPGEVPPLLTVTSQLLALLAWIRSPRGRQVLLQGTHPASNVQPPTPDGALSQEDSPYQPTPIQEEVPRGEAQGQQLPQLEEEQRAWQRLEQLILGQLEELRQQLEQQEEELGRLRLGVGATDSEKRVQHLTLENEALKQSLSLTRDLLLHWGPGPPTRAPQEEAEALLELQGRLQEAQDTTEALRVQLGVQEVQLQGLRGALQQLQQETEQNCRRELQQVHGQLAGLRTRMASLRQGCGDLRGLVSTFTQSCQGSLSEAQGQVSWALGALSAGGAGTQLPEGQQGPPTGCPGRLLELKGNIRVLCRLRPGTPCSLMPARRRSLESWNQLCCPASKDTVSASSPMARPGLERHTAWRDLLAPGPPERLAVRQGPAGQGGIQVAGLTHWDVPNLETLHQMLSLGRSNRATAATSMNPRSSRSHALVTLTLCAASPPSAPGTAGTLHLVDLAGSERAWKAGATGTQRGDPNSAQRLREAQTINRSLLALGGVMAALRARRSHVPFRDSQLTRLLQPALGPGTTAVLLLQISTRPEDLGETVCSLKFAERVGQVELGPARRRKAPRSETPSSLSTDTPLTGTPCTPTRSPVSPPSPSPDSGSCSALGPSGDLPP
ncbi:kinesin-like protein KIFC2 isoform X4 [Marmota monax]|uniref:kinesin-like protein KIFC2 isoform X4 n=1 Tax=Marmota monax TaxID=9995 RepID=UPI001EB07DAB|nr:kinesin-like protein KIFC2 isoform X4 [Marmota monax]